jgi:HSP20 family protein
MAEPTKLAVKTENVPAARPFESLRREIDRLFDDFQTGSWRLPRSLFDIEPFWRGDTSFTAPAVDIVEKNGGYEITAELPGLDPKNVEVKFSDGMLTIKGEKSEEKTEDKQDYHVSERRYGSFQRSFRVADNVDADKIVADFKNGILKITLPKSAQAQAAEKKIEIKAA